MYNKRKWLNSKKSSSTGSIVCFSGLANWSYRGDEVPVKARFIEISDCSNKVRIHQAKFETLEEYTQKIKDLKHEIEQYLIYLKNAGKQ